jgi:DNA (cytosine-5)-methyltransferase 1
MGYSLAGFEVVGVDIEPQPHYPFQFVQADAIEFITLHGHEFSAIHASPPCQAFSKCQVIRGNHHANLIEVTRNALRNSGKHYVIENVPGAPLINPVMLAGTMFNLGTMRKRLFECSFEIPFFLIPTPGARHAKMGRVAKPGEYIHVAGKGGARGVKEQWKIAMGIEWMTVRELAQAIPPAYTKFIGGYLIQSLFPNNGLHATGQAATLTTITIPGA